MTFNFRFHTAIDVIMIFIHGLTNENFIRSSLHHKRKTNQSNSRYWIKFNTETDQCDNKLKLRQKNLSKQFSGGTRNASVFYKAIVATECSWIFVHCFFFFSSLQRSRHNRWDSSRLKALLSVALIRFHWIRKRCRELDNVRDSIK